MAITTPLAPTNVKMTTTQKQKARYDEHGRKWKAQSPSYRPVGDSGESDAGSDQVEQTHQQEQVNIPPVEQVSNPVLRDLNLPIAPPEKTEKKPGFVKSKIAEAEQAKNEAQKLREDLQRIESEKTTLSEQMSELQKRIDESDSKKETEALQKQLTEKEDFAKKLLDENQTYRDRMELHDAVNSPTFRDKYEKPVVDTIGAMRRLLNNDPDLVSELDKVIEIEKQALFSATPEDRQRNEALRDELFNSIFENLPPAKQGQFSSIFYTSFLPNNSTYFEKIADGQKTVAQIRDEENRKRQEDRVRFQSTWTGAFDESSKAIDEELKYSDDVAAVVKSKAIDDNIEADLEIAKDLVSGGAKFAPREVAKIVAAGAYVKRYKAQIAAQSEIIKELEQTIAKFRGTSTSGRGGADTNGSSHVESGIDPAPNSRAALLAKWGAKR